MLNHVSIGVRSLSVAKRFYDATLSALDCRCLAEDSTSLGYGALQVSFWVLQSAKPVAPDPGSGLHFCFNAATPASVDQFHSAGLQHGGRDNGKPAIRADYAPDYYAAFLLDPDGYRIEAYCRNEQKR